MISHGRRRRGPAQPWLAAAGLLCVVAISAILWAANQPPTNTMASEAATPTPTNTLAPGQAPPTPTTAAGSATVVGVGDSVTSATVCGCTGFVESYAAHLPTADGGPARAVNLGTDGLTAAALRTAITAPGPVADGVAKGDILLVTIGANDLVPLLSQWQTSGCSSACYSPAVDTVGSDLRAILATAKALRGGRATRVLVMDYWNVFADGNVGRDSDGPAYLRWSDEITRAVNSRICAAAQNAGATCVDLYGPFKGDGSLNPTALLAADGDHPNVAGNQLISSTLLAATP